MREEAAIKIFHTAELAAPFFVPMQYSCDEHPIEVREDVKVSRTKFHSDGFLVHFTPFQVRSICSMNTKQPKSCLLST